VDQATEDNPADGRARLQQLVARLDRGELARRAAEISGGELDATQLAAHLATYLNEAVVGYDLIATTLRPGLRILEIGSGVGIVAAFLRSEGFDVVGIEPGGSAGFGFMPAMSAAISDALPAVSRPVVLPIGAEELDPQTHGKFDLIFSVNVIEHVMKLEEAMAAMASVLSPHGRMLHQCPNYAFPYEPHLAIPLVPAAPGLTRFVFPRTIARQRAIWDKVNFVTAGRIRALARSNGLGVRFEPGIMGHYFARARSDSEFSKRHPGVIGKITASPLLGTIVGRMLAALPADLATPMRFVLNHNADR
jgi:2-polyprenyl-3-methyl-5-hydroxy-6-metoxy-1,4-benzoquinol methylase